MNRLFLYSGFLFILILIFDAYDRDYNKPAVPVVSEQVDQSDTSSKQPPVEGTGNRLSEKTTNSSPIIETLENKKLLVEFDTLTGELLFAQLKEYPVKLFRNALFLLLKMACRNLNQNRLFLVFEPVVYRAAR